MATHLVNLGAPITAFSSLHTERGSSVDPVRGHLRKKALMSPHRLFLLGDDQSFYLRLVRDLFFLVGCWGRFGKYGDSQCCSFLSDCTLFF